MDSIHKALYPKKSAVTFFGAASHDCFVLCNSVWANHTAFAILLRCHCLFFDTCSGSQCSAGNAQGLLRFPHCICVNLGLVANQAASPSTKSLQQVYRPVCLYSWAAKRDSLQSLLNIRQISTLNRRRIKTWSGLNFTAAKEEFMTLAETS